VAAETATAVREREHGSVEEVTPMGVNETVRDVVLSVVGDHDVELYDLEVQGPVVRVFVDRAGGVDLEVLSAVTRAVSRGLDAADPIGHRYTLEVTSPGLERKLRTPEQFIRAVGEMVKVKTKPDVEGERRVEGALTNADSDGITVGDRKLAYHEIERARTVFEWGTEKKRERRS
jgi:ribosome maturation factor RimP